MDQWKHATKITSRLVLSALLKTKRQATDFGETFEFFFFPCFTGLLTWKEPAKSRHCLTIEKGAVLEKVPSCQKADTEESCIPNSTAQQTKNTPVSQGQDVAFVWLRDVTESCLKQHRIVLQYSLFNIAFIGVHRKYVFFPFLSILKQNTWDSHPFWLRPSNIPEQTKIFTFFDNIKEKMTGWMSFKTLHVKSQKYQATVKEEVLYSH